MGIEMIRYDKAALLRDEHIGELLYNRNKENVFALEDGGRLYDFIFAKIVDNANKGAGPYVNIGIQDSDKKYLCQIHVRGEQPRNEKMNFTGQVLEISFYETGSGMLEQLALKRSSERTKILKLPAERFSQKAYKKDSSEESLPINPILLALLFSLLYEKSISL